MRSMLEELRAAEEKFHNARNARKESNMSKIPGPIEVTITGPQGSGKSRLATMIAADLAERGVEYRLRDGEEEPSTGARRAVEIDVRQPLHVPALDTRHAMGALREIAHALGVDGPQELESGANARIAKLCVDRIRTLKNK